MLVIILIIVAIGAVLSISRIIHSEIRPHEIDRFRDASSLTSAWSRGEEWPPAYPDKPADQRSSSPAQGLPRSSRT